MPPRQRYHAPRESIQERFKRDKAHRDAVKVARLFRQEITPIDREAFRLKVSNMTRDVETPLYDEMISKRQVVGSIYGHNTADPKLVEDEERFWKYVEKLNKVCGNVNLTPGYLPYGGDPTGAPFAVDAGENYYRNFRMIEKSCKFGASSYEELTQNLIQQYEADVDTQVRKVYDNTYNELTKPEKLINVNGKESPKEENLIKINNLKKSALNRRENELGGLFGGKRTKHKKTKKANKKSTRKTICYRK